MTARVGSCFIALLAMSDVQSCQAQAPNEIVWEQRDFLGTFPVSNPVNPAAPCFLTWLQERTIRLKPISVPGALNYGGIYATAQYGFWAGAFDKGCRIAKEHDFVLVPSTIRTWNMSGQQTDSAITARASFFAFHSNYLDSPTDLFVGPFEATYKMEGDSITDSGGQGLDPSGDALRLYRPGRAVPPFAQFLESFVRGVHQGDCLRTLQENMIAGLSRLSAFDTCQLAVARRNSFGAIKSFQTDQSFLLNRFLPHIQSVESRGVPPNADILLLVRFRMNLQDAPWFGQAVIGKWSDGVWRVAYLWL